MAGKLRLHPDALRVESFAATTPAPAERGTVQAHEPFTRYGNETCRPFFTCPECAPPAF